MLHIPGLENEVSWYLEAARKAGREVVEQGRISAETQSILDKPLAPDPAAYAEMTNVYWESLGVEMPGQTAAAPAEDAGEGTPLEPPASLATIRDLIAGMPTVFQPDAAGDLEAVIGFDVTDEEPGDYYLTIEEGVCRAFAGRHPSPTMTIHTPAEVWMKISRGEMDGAVAFMTREYKVSGKVDLLMRLAKLFKRKKA